MHNFKLSGISSFLKEEIVFCLIIRCLLEYGQSLNNKIIYIKITMCKNSNFVEKLYHSCSHVLHVQMYKCAFFHLF